MGLIGSIAGAGLKIGSSIFGGIKASKAMKKVKKNLNKQMEENRNWYDRRYNEDSTERADAQAILTKTQDAIRERNRQAAGAQAVMGGTDESLAQAREANNDALAQAATNIAVAGDARKDNIEQQYMENKSSLQSQLNNMEINKANTIMQAAGGVADAASEIESIF